MNLGKDFPQQYLKEDVIMKITIVGRQMNVWDEMKSTIDSKLKKLDKYFSDECNATVTLSSRKNSKCLEITIIYDGTIFRSDKTSHDWKRITTPLDTEAEADLAVREYRSRKCIV